MPEQQAANRKLYISDWHYGHNNILAFDNRPFKTVEEMNAALVERWNAAVHPGDTVYVLGDTPTSSCGGWKMLSPEINFRKHGKKSTS